MTRAPLSQLDDWQLENSDQDIRGWPVQDQAGNMIGTVTEMIVNTDVQYVDAIILDNGAEIPTSDIEIGNGVVYLLGVAPVEAVEPAETAPLRTAASAETALRERDEETVVPIVQEEVRTGKRAVERGGIRIRKRVEEVPINEQVTVRDETVDVERRKVDRPASEADLATFREGTVEVRERHEEPVVEKEARVTGEVVVDKDVQERTETVQGTERRTDVDVEQLGERKQGS
jgi:stress response protein YsnF